VVQISMVSVYWQRSSDNRQRRLCIGSAVLPFISANPFVSLST